MSFPVVTTWRAVLLRWLALLSLSLMAATAMAQGSAELRVGSKRFTESYILAEILAQTARQGGYPARVNQGLGNTAIVYEALRAGQIDVYAEYTGTIAQEIVKDPSKTTIAELDSALAPMGLGVGVPLGFNNSYALAMRAEQASALGITRLSDLARHPELKLGLSNEFIGRADGWRGLATRYGFTQQPRGLDHGLAYEALAQRQIDVMDIYTTDTQIGKLGLVVLADDQAYFPRYDAVLLYRRQLPEELPATWQALQRLEGSISEADMIAMNGQAVLQSQAFDQIAQGFVRFLLGGPGSTAAPAGAASDVDHVNAAAAGALPLRDADGQIIAPALPASAASAPAAGAAAQDGFITRFWQRLWAADLWRLLGQHMLLVGVSVGLATLIAVPLGIALFPRPKWRALALGTAGVLQTIPSLALLAVLIAMLGVIGKLPALIALTAYSVLPILSNTCAGLAEVPPGVRNAAAALGMTRKQRLTYVEFPLALPTVLAGIRTATAIAIGTATVAAFIGAGGLGERIVTGLALNDSALLLAGALPAAGLALVSEALFELVGRRLAARRSPARSSQRARSGRGRTSSGKSSTRSSNRSSEKARRARSSGGERAQSTGPSQRAPSVSKLGSAEGPAPTQPSPISADRPRRRVAREDGAGRPPGPPSPRA